MSFEMIISIVFGYYTAMYIIHIPEFKRITKRVQDQEATIQALQTELRRRTENE